MAKVVKIQVPNGAVIKVEGPDDATDDQFLSEGQRLYQEEYQPIYDKQKADYPTAGERGGQPGQAVDKTSTMLSRAKAALGQVGSNASGMVQGAGQLMGSKGPIGQLQAAAGIPGALYHGLVDPASNAIKDIKNRDYDSLSRDAVDFSFQTLPTIGAIGSGVKSSVTKALDPESLMTRAANLRSKTGTGLPPGTPTSARMLKTAIDLTRKPRAAVMEGTAKIGAKISDTLQGRPTTNLEIPPDPPVSILPGRGVDNRRIQPSSAERNPIPIGQYESTPVGQTPQLGIERPGVPLAAQQELEQANQSRVPDPMEFQTKTPAQPGAEIPFEPTEDLFGKPEIPVAPDHFVQLAEQAIGPRAGTIERLVPQLLEVAPEVKGLRGGPVFDSTLLKAMKRVESNVDAADSLVSPDVTVPKAELQSAFQDLANKYRGYGQERTATQIEAESGKLDSLPDMIPWDKFRNYKRGFFKENKYSSGPLRETYGILMDASSKHSNLPALAEANHAYTVVRRAIDTAGISRISGRRINQIGKTPTAMKVDKVKQLRGLP